jgi:hypothetical protein
MPNQQLTLPDNNFKKIRAKIVQGDLQGEAKVKPKPKLSFGLTQWGNQLR